MMTAVLDHLWQSTLVALGAALLTVPLRKAAAGVRYGLWFTASVKFLIPFAALAALGRLLAPALRSPSSAAPEAVFIAQVARPLSQFPFAHAAALRAPLSPSQAVAAAAAPHLDLIPILLAVWVLGSAAVLALWMMRASRVRAAVRSATPLPWSAPMPVLASSSLMEPGLIGLWRPVLLVPETLPDHLSQPEIDAVLAHEASHLRRRDNLTAAVHMLVEALFWFHPLVWWIGACLIEERERACDEAVVEAGHSRAAYARGLVETCRLYLQSPLPCVAGASGSKLKIRVEMIMTAPPSSPLSRSTKTLLIAAGLCALATPVAAGLLTSPAGQTVVARAASTFKAWPASLASGAPASGQTETVQPIRLARNKAVLGPARAVTETDAPPLALARDVPLRLAALTPPASAVQAPQPQPAPVEPAALPMSRADARDKASSFVESYAEATAGRHVIARWENPICVRVVGLEPDQAAAVRARIEEVARAVDLRVQPAECKRSNIEIGFTTEPQRMLDGVIAGKGALLGDRTSDTRAARTITLPVQAWYETNGVDFAENTTTDSAAALKVPARYQWTAQQQADWNAQAGAGNGNASTCCTAPAPAGEAWPDSRGSRQFLNVFVIVDLRRTGDRSLGLLTDYVAMLALSQSQALDRCNVLPSVTDLYAGACPGRAAPQGLSTADAAYLTALYGRHLTDRYFAAGGQRSAIAASMAGILANAKVASR